MKGKTFILLVCLFGILGVCYGILIGHPVFIIGLVFLVVGYLMIRRELKAHIREKYSSEDQRGRPSKP